MRERPEGEGEYRCPKRGRLFEESFSRQTIPYTLCCKLVADLTKYCLMPIVQCGMNISRLGIPRKRLLRATVVTLTAYSESSHLALDRFGRCHPEVELMPQVSTGLLREFRNRQAISELPPWSIWSSPGLQSPGTIVAPMLLHLAGILR